MRTIQALTLLLGAGLSVGAHELYIMPVTFFPAPGASVTIGLHVGDSFPESEVAGKLERMLDPKLISATGSFGIQKLRVDGRRLIGDGAVSGPGEWIAAIHTLPALIELTPDQFNGYLREEGLTAILDWRAQHGESAKPGKERYSKYAKSLLLSGPTDGFARRDVGFLIEIVPEADPYTLKPGDSLPIQVRFRGQPAADLQVESTWTAAGDHKTTVAGRTGPDGRLKVKLPAAGVWRLHTIKMERCSDAAIADWESYWANLTLELR